MIFPAGAVYKCYPDSMPPNNFVSIDTFAY